MTLGSVISLCKILSYPLIFYLFCLPDSSYQSSVKVLDDLRQLYETKIEDASNVSNLATAISSTPHWEVAGVQAAQLSVVHLSDGQESLEFGID